MKQALFERRTKMLRYLAKGVPLRDIIKDFSAEYNVSDKAIYKDHRKMKDWGPQILQLQDDKIIYEMLEGLKQIIPNAWHEYLTGDNTSAKVGALKLAKETYLDLIKVLQSIGRIEKVPEKAEVTAKVGIIVKMYRPDQDEPTN